MMNEFLEKSWRENEDNDDPGDVIFVERAVRCLAPHFEISSQDKRWSKFKFLRVVSDPDIKIGLYQTFYSLEFSGPKMYLPAYFSSWRTRCTIGHEVGHFMHDISDHEKYLRLPSQGDIAESIARYSKIIFLNRGINPFQNPRFSLLELVRMDPDTNGRVAQEVERFHYQLIEELNRMGALF